MGALLSRVLRWRHPKTLVDPHVGLELSEAHGQPASASPSRTVPIKAYLPPFILLPSFSGKMTGGPCVPEALARVIMAASGSRRFSSLQHSLR